MNYVVGVDEAGRGPLAGPVAVGLVHAREDFDILANFPGLNDSKKLTEKARERLFGLLEAAVERGEITYAVEMQSAADIDERGIALVIREAIKSGLEKLCARSEEIEYTKIWLDGALRAPSLYAQETVIGGDALIPSIMLASVAAKVTRDRLMVELHDTHPAYNFAKHKGYGTKAHMDALRTHGLCAIHRSTFIHLDRIPTRE